MRRAIYIILFSAGLAARAPAASAAPTPGDVNITALIDKSPQALKVKRDPVDAMAPFAVCAELK